MPKQSCVPPGPHSGPQDSKPIALLGRSLVVLARGQSSGFGATCSERPSLTLANLQAACGGHSLPGLVYPGRWKKAVRWCFAQKRPGLWTAHRVLNQAQGRRSAGKGAELQED